MGQPTLEGGACSRNSGFGFRVSGLRFQVSSFEFRVSGFRFRVSGFGSRVSGLGSQVSGFGFRVSGFRSRVSRFGFEWPSRDEASPSSSLAEIAPTLRAGGTLALSQSIWAHQPGETGLFNAPKLTNWFRKPNMSTREKSDSQPE